VCLIDFDCELDPREFFVNGPDNVHTIAVKKEVEEVKYMACICK
jgi:hypothetical protein